MKLIRRIIKRLRCKHDKVYLDRYYHVSSDLFGYEYTKFIFNCSICGERHHVFKTRDPEYFIDLLAEAYEEER